MATTTKSKSTRKPSSAKKTTKTKTVKSSKATTAKATTAKATAKKPVAKKPVVTVTEVKTTVKSSNKPVITPLDRIKSVHVSIAAAYLVFTALIVGFVTTAATAITLGLQTRDQFSTTTDKVVLGPANETLFSIEPKYVLAASLLVSVVASIFFATKLRARYESTLANSTSGFRWIVGGITAAILITYVNLLAGVTDLATLKMSAALILVTSLLAFIAERDNVGATSPKWFAYLTSLLTGLLAWFPVAGAFIGTTLYGKEHFGWHVYAIAAVTFLGFAGLALRQRGHLRSGVQKDYIAVEATYLNIDLMTKFAVVIITIIALK